MTDTYKHQGLRKNLVAILKEKKIQDQAVLEAIGKVPRHFFLDSQFDNYAYQDMAFKIGAGQTISQPYTVAFQSELLQVKKGMKVLEVGTGSGYQAVILCELGAKVFTIERQRSLYDKAKVFLPSIGYHPRFFYGDGYAGLPVFAPFDRIIVTCGAPYIPEKLVEQLKPGGRMVIPVGEGEDQTMLLVTKNESGEVTKKEYGTFRFVPMLKDKATGG